MFEKYEPSTFHWKKDWPSPNVNLDEDVNRTLAFIGATAKALPSDPKLELRKPPVTHGHFRLFVDVTTVELFAENGLANLSLAIQYIKNDDMLNLTLQGNATIHSATLYPLELD